MLNNCLRDFLILPLLFSSILASSSVMRPKSSESIAPIAQVRANDETKNTTLLCKSREPCQTPPSVIRAGNLRVFLT